MCEDGALDVLLSMNFRGLVKEVEASLSFKARNADPRARTNYSQILYTWYTFRGDYRSGTSRYLAGQVDANSIIQLRSLCTCVPESYRKHRQKAQVSCPLLSSRRKHCFLLSTLCHFLIERTHG
jgi:hypothetical protein